MASAARPCALGRCSAAPWRPEGRRDDLVRLRLARAWRAVKWNGAMRADLRRVALCAAIALAACSAKPPESQTYLAGRPIDLQELTAQDVARAVQITPRGDDVFFQAPPIQKTK